MRRAAALSLGALAGGPRVVHATAISLVRSAGACALAARHRPPSSPFLAVGGRARPGGEREGAQMLPFIHLFFVHVPLPARCRCFCAAVAVLGVVSIAQVHQTVLAAPATHITRTPSRIPDIPIYGMGYNDRCAARCGEVPHAGWGARCYQTLDEQYLSCYIQGITGWAGCVWWQAGHQAAVHSRDRQAGDGGLHTAYCSGLVRWLGLVWWAQSGEQHWGRRRKLVLPADLHPVHQRPLGWARMRQLPVRRELRLLRERHGAR